MKAARWARPLAAGSLVSLVALVAVACGGAGASSSAIPPASPAAGRGTAVAGKAVSAQPAQTSTGALPGNPAATGVPLPSPAAEGPQVIRSGQVSLEVKSGQFDSTYSALIGLAGEEGGSVSASSAATDSGRIRSGVITLSVPSGHFQDTLDRLRQMGTVQAINVSSQDVSQQYVDLKARLANAEAERDAMLALLQKAQSVQDILAVQNQLGNYTQQVEQLQGQIDYLDHATSYSTIQVTVREPGIAAPRPAVDDWGLATAFWNGLHALVQSFDGLVMVLIVVGPYALLAGLGWLLWRRRRAAAGAL